MSATAGIETPLAPQVPGLTLIFRTAELLEARRMTENMLKLPKQQSLVKPQTGQDAEYDAILQRSRVGVGVGRLLGLQPVLDDSGHCKMLFAGNIIRIELNAVADRNLITPRTDCQYIVLAQPAHDEPNGCEIVGYAPASVFRVEQLPNGRTTVPREKLLNIRRLRYVIDISKLLTVEESDTDPVELFDRIFVYFSERFKGFADYFRDDPKGLFNESLSQLVAAVENPTLELRKICVAAFVTACNAATKEIGSC